MFVKYTGNEINTTTKSLVSKPDSAIRKALTDPMVVAPEKVAGSFPSAASSISGRPQKQPRIIEEDRPTLFDELATTAPTNLDRHIFAHSVIDDPMPPAPYESYYSDMEK
jgi:hypothetical protein